MIQKGTLVRADQDGLTLATTSGERTIGIAQVLRIRRRTNGLMLGTLIGAGAGVVNVVLYYALSGEGVAPGVLMLGLGVGAGAAIDGALGRRRIVYERPEVAGQPDALSEGVRVFVSGGLGLGSNDSPDLVGSTSATHLSTGVLFRVAGGPLSAGPQVDIPQAVEDTGFGLVVSVDLGPRTRS